MTWAHKRQLTILAILIACGLIILALIIVPKITKPATCSDGRQNGTESGIDCGGICKLYCVSDVQPLTIQWSRALPVTGSIYNLVAYIENPNRDAGIRSINYEFRIYDADNIFIAKREGVTYVNPNGAFVVFEGGVDVGNRPPKYTIFEFKGTPRFERVDPRALDVFLSSQDIQIENLGTRPRLIADIENSSIYEISNITAVALLFDENENVVGASSTVIESILPGSRDQVFFTWPVPFMENIVNKKIYPRTSVFEIPLR